MTIARSVSTVTAGVASAVTRGQGAGGSSYDSDAQAYITAVEGDGGSFAAGIGETAVKNAVNALVESLKDNSVWDTLTHLWAPACIGASGLTKSIKGGDVTFNGYTLASHWNFTTGLANASSRWIDAPTGATSQSFSLGCYSSGRNSGTAFSQDDGTLTNVMNIYDRSANWGGSGSACGSGRALWAASSGGGNRIVHRDGLQVASLSGNGTVLTGYNYKVNKAGSGFHGDTPVFASFCGTELSAAQHLALAQALRAYQVALGRESASGVVCFGDSITGGYTADNQFSTQIATATGKRVYAIGYPGARLTVIGLSTYQTVFGAYSFDEAYINYGVNDIAGSVAAATYQSALDTVVSYLINTLGKSPTNITIGSPGFTTTVYAARADYTAAARAVAVLYGTKYADVFQAMTDGGGATLMADSVHPNQSGHNVMYTALSTATVPT